MIDASSSEVEQFLREAVDNRAWPMACDLVSTNHILAALRPFMRVSKGMVEEAIDHICPKGSLLEQRPWFGGTRLRLRAIRDYDKYRQLPAKALKDAYRMPTPPGQGESEGGYTIYRSDDGVDTDERY
jgi:hypothetical protein